MNIETLKKKYKVGNLPSPNIECSILGALCLEMVPDSDHRKQDVLPFLQFPTPMIAAEFLAIANFSAAEQSLLQYAEEIEVVTNNQEYEKAWTLLEEALHAMD